MKYESFQGSSKQVALDLTNLLVNKVEHKIVSSIAMPDGQICVLVRIESPLPLTSSLSTDIADNELVKHAHMEEHYAFALNNPGILQEPEEDYES